MTYPTLDDLVAIVKPHNDKLIAECRLAQAERKIAQMQKALTYLSNEVLASLPLMEPLARREFGNTNYAILIQRAEEARTLLNGEGR